MTRLPRSSRRSHPSGRCGAAAVEFAMTAPILLVLLFTALEIGRMNMVRQAANNAAYEAARKCCVPGATAAEGETAGLTLLQAAGVQGGSVDVQPDTIIWDTLNVTATVTIPYANNTWVTPLLSKNRSVTVACRLTRDWAVSMRQP